MSTTDFERKKRELCDALNAVAETMRSCAQIASNFSKIVAAKGKRKRAVQTRAKKDPDAPKRPSSAYLHFQNDVRGWYKENRPGLAYSALVEEMAKKWKELTPDQKEKYNNMVDEDKKRFEHEMREYRIRKGLDPDEKPKGRKLKGPNPDSQAPSGTTKTREVTEELSAPNGSEGEEEEEEEIAAAAAVGNESEDDDESGEEEERDAAPPPAKRSKGSKSKA